MSGLMATLPAWGLIPADPSAPSPFSPADSRGQGQILSKPGSSHKICPLVLPSTLCILESEHLASTLLIFVELMNAGVNEEISGTCTALSTFHINFASITLSCSWDSLVNAGLGYLLYSWEN